jgi:RNA polymerase sigma factor (TIGR02999 family)
VAEQPGEITQVLHRWSQGDRAAGDELMKQVYAQLRRIAQARLMGERANHTLQPTALVHEAYLKIVQGETLGWKDRVHFIAVTARAMRQIVIDSGRRRQAAKRQMPESPTVFLQAMDDVDRSVDLMALDQALQRLESLDQRQAQIVELKYFGGLTTEEIASVLAVSEATINRNWRAARSWLFLELGERSIPRKGA